MANNVFHGSDIEKIEELYGINKNKIINYSANVNPLGMPKSTKMALIDNINALEAYPDRDNVDIKKSLEKYSNVDLENIIIGNGASEVTKIVFEIINPKKTLIIGPTYSEYEKELKFISDEIEYFLLNEKEEFILNIDKLKNQLEDNFNLLVLCNPNNPTSSLIKRKEIEEIVGFCKEHNIFVFIDETYIEFIEDFSKINDYSAELVNNEKYDNLIVTRGVSKFFALPGLRFGYGMTNNKNIIKVANEKMNTWSVNSLVNHAVVSFCNDNEFFEMTNVLINNERNKIVERLNKIKNIKLYKPNANFVLIKILNERTSNVVFENALKHNLMIRNCESFYGLDDKFIRFCFLGTEENEKLLAFLEEEFK